MGSKSGKRHAASGKRKRQLQTVNSKTQIEQRSVQLARCELRCVAKHKVLFLYLFTEGSFYSFGYSSCGLRCVQVISFVLGFEF